jgi:subtilase family serine protease
VKDCLIFLGKTILFLVLGSFVSLHVFAQANQPKSRITQAIDENDLSALTGSTHPLARAEFDQGPVSPELVGQRMLLLFSRSPEQESSLQQLLAQQQDSSSSNYHKWLTPEQFGQQFGPSDQDVQTIRSWLSSHGLQVASVSAGRGFIEFSGTADQVQQTFHTSIHNLNVNGEAHIANMSDARIPTALTPVVKGVVGLHNFSPKSTSLFVGSYSRSKETGEIKPDITGTSTNGNSFYAIGPADFATVYNVLPLWRGNAPLTSPVDGMGVSIAIVGASNINLQDVMSFRTLFGLPTNLPANTPRIVLNGPDPGIVKGLESEAVLDVEWSGAVAKNAQIILVVSENALSVETFGTSGQDLSALYIVDNNLAPVMSESFQACEGQNLNASTFYTALWGQAAAQGITSIVSSGDGGPAGCDNFDTESEATLGISVNAIASTPYNVAVGGTDFDDVGNERTFFPNFNITTADGYTFLSAVGYVPEIPWDDSCAQSGIGNCTSNSGKLLNIRAGSGGPSAVVPKPTWQNGVGSAEIQSDGKRDIPDVSFFASDGGTRTNPSFYAVCQADAVSNPAQSCITTGPFLFAGGGGLRLRPPRSQA